MTASVADNEIWHVLIASDDMKRMNVDQLDDAFRLSLIDASTMVWKAGMQTWRRLGSIAGIDDEPETIARPVPPPPPRPLARPAPRPPSRVPAPTRPVPVFATPLVAPVYTPPLHAPDPYVLPKRRVAIPSEVDFRRASGGVRWGRWLLAFLIVTGGVLGAYRQNLLRDGARRIGLEGKYLYGEHRATAFVAAKSPAPLKLVLTRLALLPGPNALPPVTAAPRPTPAPEAPAVAAPAIIPASASEPEVKTVSLDSLPLLTDEPAPEPASPTPVVHTAASRAKAPVAVAAVPPKPTPAKAAPRAAKAEPTTKAPPPAKAPPPLANDNPLKAAIRSAIAADAAKKK